MPGPRELTASDARLLRTRAQLLDPARAAASVPDAVRAVVGLQAQSWPAAVLGVRPRTSGLTALDVELARSEERTVVRSWFMRGTLHLVSAEDVGWLLGLLGPGFVRASASRRAQLGLDEDAYSRGVTVLQKALSDGPRTRAEIAGKLVAEGVPIDPKTQALIHLIQRAALEGLVCYGPDRGGRQQLVPLRDWIDVGPTLDPEVALAELARRYLAAFAPADPGDLAKWSGLPMPRCRAAFARLADELAEVRVEGRPAWTTSAALRRLGELRARDAHVRLLPAFDTYLLGYADRKAEVDARYVSRVWNAGMIHPTLQVDGCAIGTWKDERKRTEVLVRVSPFTRLDRPFVPAIEEEAADVGRFLGLTPRLEVDEAED